MHPLPPVQHGRRGGRFRRQLQGVLRSAAAGRAAVVAAAGRWRGATAAQKTPASQASATGRSRTRAGVNSCMVAAGYAQHGRPRAESGEAGRRFEAGRVAGGRGRPRYIYMRGKCTVRSPRVFIENLGTQEWPRITFSGAGFIKHGASALETAHVSTRRRLMMRSSRSSIGLDRVRRLSGSNLRLPPLVGFTCGWTRCLVHWCLV